jgi:hypothetical protein
VVAELVLRWDGGELDLNGPAEGSAFTIEMSENGADWGNPEAVRQQVTRALLNGSASVLERYDNREVVLDLRIVASDARGLAAGEKALALALGARQCELVWTPPDEYATPVAFIVVAGDLEIESGNDAFELLLIRSYRLTLTCLPHVRSIEPVTIEALPPFVAAPSTLDDCSSAAGWTVDDPNTTLSVSGGVEVLIDHDQPPGPALFVTHPGGITMSERYLAIEQTGFEQVGVVGVTLNGSTALPLVGAEGGWRFYDADAYTGTPVTSLVFGFFGLKSGYPSWPDFTIATIAESATPAATTGRQSLRVLQVGGSAAVDASIAIEARNADADGGGDSLGTVYLYSGSNYDPRLSPSSLEYSGARATDTAALSGSSETGTFFVFGRPVASIPTGDYVVYARAKGTASATVTWSLLSNLATPAGMAASNAIAYNATIGTVHTFAGTAYNLINLGTINLPGLKAGQGQGLWLRFMLSASASSTVDEVLLFNRSTGRLAIVALDTRDRLINTAGVWTVSLDAGETRLWFDSANLRDDETILAGSPSKAMGTPVDLDSNILAYDGMPLLVPGENYLYVATSGSIEPVVTGTFRTAGHTSLDE